MNVTIKLSISDPDRKALKQLLTGKESSRMVSRAEVNEIINCHWAGVIAQANREPNDDLHPSVAETKSKLYQIDHRDPLTPLMARPDDPGYVRGWNTARSK